MPPAPHTSFTGIDYGHSEGLVVSLPVWSGLEFIQQLLKRLHNEFCTDIFVQRMIPWGWTWLTLVITQQKHRVLICVICDAVSFVIFIDLLDAFGFICSERCSCTESPDLTAVQSKMAWHVLYLIVSFLSCFCVGDSTTRTVSSHALTRCQVRTSLSVLCLPLYRFQPHLHSGG